LRCCLRFSFLPLSVRCISAQCVTRCRLPVTHTLLPLPHTPRTCTSNRFLWMSELRRVCADLRHLCLACWIDKTNVITGIFHSLLWRQRNPCIRLVKHIMTKIPFTWHRFFEFSAFLILKNLKP
jgi:hypothetical protein